MKFPRIKRRPLKLSAFLGYCLLLGGLQIAWQGSLSLLYVLYGGALVSVFLGLISCLLSAYYFPGILINGNTPFEKGGRPQAGGIFVPSEGFKKIAIWCLHFLAFAVLSLYYFRFLEMQTQMSPRLQALVPGTIAALFKEKALYLSLIPCCLYGLLGLGVAFVSVAFKKKPVLWEMIRLLVKDEKSKRFCRNLVCLPIELVQQGCFVLVSTFMALWTADTLCALFHWDPLLLKPMRLVFMSALVMMLLRKSSLQLIDWAIQWKISIAKSLMIYWSIIMFCLFWFQMVSNWFSEGMVLPDSTIVLKSALAGSWSAEILETRLSLLLLGWTCLWLPWMVSVAAKTAIGSSFIGALLKLVLLPSVMVGCGLAWMHHLPSKNLDFLAIVAMLYWLNQMWGKIVQVADIHAGAMSTVKTPSTAQRSFRRWMIQMLSWISGYLLGHLMMGWLLPQFMMTMAAIFMIGIGVFFSVAWGLVVIRYGVLKKYKEGLVLDSEWTS